MDIATKDTFEERYCKESGISLEKYHTFRVTLPCRCDYDGCEGWGAVGKDRNSIRAHMQFYGPRKGDTKDGKKWDGEEWVKE